MNLWENTIVTTKGMTLLSRMTTGSNITITKALIGSGYVNPTLLPSQTGVSSSKQEATFKSVKYPEPGKCAVTCSINNHDLAVGYTARQIGVYANDPVDGEVLFFIAQVSNSESGIVVPSETEMGSYNAEWKFTFQYGQADGVNVTVDPAAAVTQTAMEAYVAEVVSGFSYAEDDLSNVSDDVFREKVAESGAGSLVVTTTGSGSVYKAELPGVTALTPGLSFIMIPHTASTTTSPTLNINNLGAKTMRVPLTTNNTATTTPTLSTWLSANKPVRMMYDGTYWVADIPRPAAGSLYGTTPVANGGTGVDTLEANSFLVGNGASAMVSKTPEQVRELINGAYTFTQTVTVTSTWTASGNHFTQNIAVSNLETTDEPIVDIAYSGDNDADVLYEKCISKLVSVEVVSATQIKVVASEEIANAFPIRLKVVR